MASAPSSHINSASHMGQLINVPTSAKCGLHLEYCSNSTVTAHPPEACALSTAGASTVHLKRALCLLRGRPQST
eukprot:1188072-Prorocentrum_minimum.AAC.3